MCAAKIYICLDFLWCFPCTLLASKNIVSHAIWCNKHLYIFWWLQIALATSPTGSCMQFYCLFKIYLCLLTQNCIWNHVITYIYNTTKVVFNFLFGKKGIFKLILRSELEVTAAFLQVEFKSRYYLVYAYIIIIVTHCCCDVIICFLCKIKFNEKIF